MPINLSALWVDILVSLWWPPLGAFVLSCLRTGTWAPVFVRRCISVTLTVSHSLWVFNVYASHRFVGNQAPPVVSEKFRIEFFHYINLYKNYRINVILSNPEKNVCFFFLGNILPVALYTSPHCMYVYKPQRFSFNSSDQMLCFRSSACRPVLSRLQSDWDFSVFLVLFFLFFLFSGLYCQPLNSSLDLIQVSWQLVRGFWTLGNTEELLLKWLNLGAVIVLSFYFCQPTI